MNNISFHKLANKLFFYSWEGMIRTKGISSIKNSESSSFYFGEFSCDLDCVSHSGFEFARVFN